MNNLIIKKINLKEGEEIIDIVRHYILTFAMKIIVSLALLMAPFFFIFPLFKLGYWGVVVFVSLIFFGIIYFLRIIAIWYYNSFVITNKRVVDIDQRGFFERIVSEAPYEKIEDISWRRKGILQTIFRYGDVRIQIVGSSVGFEIRNIRNPDKIHQLIVNLSQAKKNFGQEDNFDFSVPSPDAEEFKIIKESIDDLEEKQLEELEGIVRRKLRQIRLKKIEEIKNFSPKE